MSVLAQMGESMPSPVVMKRVSGLKTAAGFEATQVSGDGWNESC